MRVEGVGFKVPAPKRVRIPSDAIAICRVEGRRRACFRGYTSGRTPWQRGHTRDPVGTGLLGEYAVGEFLDEPMDTKLYANGDGGHDFVVNGVTMDVKTARYHGGSALNRRVDEKTLRPLKADVYIFCTWNEGRKEIFIRGWATRQQISEWGSFRPGRARGSTHWNVELEPKFFEPMSRLRTHLANAGSIACR